MKAEQALSLADSLYVDEDYEQAVDVYTVAQTLLDDEKQQQQKQQVQPQQQQEGKEEEKDSTATSTNKTTTTTTTAPLNVLRFRIWSHRSAAFYQLQRYQEAHDDAQHANAMTRTTTSTTTMTDKDKKKDTLLLPQQQQQENVVVVTLLSLLRSGETELALRRQGLAAMQLYKTTTAAAADADNKNNNMNNIALDTLQAAQQLAQLNQRPSATTLYPSLIQQCQQEQEEKVYDKTMMMTTTTASVAEASAVASNPKSQVTTTTTTTTATSQTTTDGKSKSQRRRQTVPKYQYYQSDQIMTVAILEPNVTHDELHVEFTSQSLTVLLDVDGGNKKNDMTLSSSSSSSSMTVITGTLYAPIHPDLSKVKIRPEKVLLKLRKVNAMEWPELLTTATTNNNKGTTKTTKIGGDKSSSSSSSTTTSSKMTTSPTAAGADVDADAATASLEIDSKPSANNSTAVAAGVDVDANVTTTEPTTTTTTSTSTSSTTQSTTQKKVVRPYSSHKDWDSIERELERQEEEEGNKPQGDEAMNKLFQQIYANADEDTRRAMIKSYQTSGGTVLSTNWKEVSEKDYEKERTAPKGMEWKTWEGDKLPMKNEE